jgi:hypothetical protein
MLRKTNSCWAIVSHLKFSWHTIYTEPFLHARKRYSVLEYITEWQGYMNGYVNAISGVYI